LRRVLYHPEAGTVSGIEARTDQEPAERLEIAPLFHLLTLHNPAKNQKIQKMIRTLATLPALDRKALHEVLNMDPAASMQFLGLLNRMLCRRLREINEKIVQWKYIVGVGA